MAAAGFVNSSNGSSHNQPQQPTYVIWLTARGQRSSICDDAAAVAVRRTIER